LKNRYYAFRHGQSRANAEGIIVSDPAVGTVDYGLTAAGRQQVRASVLAADSFDSASLIVSSDFLRARETAEMILALIDADNVLFDERLRERFFGAYEGKSQAHYSEAWEKDLYDPEQVSNGAESADAVRERMWAVVESLEKRYTDRTIILVSHGDPLMLLQTIFDEKQPGAHRSLPYIPTAGWRLLNS